MIRINDKKYVICFEPSSLRTEVLSGTTIMEAANKVGIYLSNICGGDGYCGKCKVVVDQGHFKTRPTTLLTAEEIHENIVLACQTRIFSDMVVTVPEYHTIKAGQILTDSDARRFSNFGIDDEENDFSLDPLVKKLYLQMKQPSVDDHTADHEHLYFEIRENIDAPIMQTGFRILQKLSPVLRSCDYKATVTLGRRGQTTELMDVVPGNTSLKNYAVAVDLGTTTVVAHLLNLIDGSTVDTEAMYNSQLNFGEDYIRRIIYAEENDAFDVLQDRIVHDVNSLIMILAVRKNIDLQDISAVMCTGNTAMIHFLLNLDPTRIRREPYIASAAFVPPIRAAETGIQINKRGLLYCMPSVSVYVGSDIVAGILATGIYTKEEISLFVDIGTNGEIALGNKEWIVCASSSAGPAFEGSGVKNGMRAQAGAIEKLMIRPDLSIDYKTIGNMKPVGICGSGLLDTIAELFANNIIDRTGKFSDNLDKRFTEDEDGKQFELVQSQNGNNSIVITQSDIDNLIRSKAGVFAAIKVLLDSTQTELSDIDTIYLAGGFGNFLNTAQAVAIGMLPDIPVEKIRYVGNTAIAGAKLSMLSRNAFEVSEQIAKNMTYFDLMNHPLYMDEFIRACFIPHTDMALFPSANHVKVEKVKSLRKGK